MVHICSNILLLTQLKRQTPPRGRVCLSYPIYYLTHLLYHSQIENDKNRGIMFFHQFKGRKEKAAVILKPWIYVRKRISLVLAFTLRVLKVTRSLAQRKPMLLFVFPGVLFRFAVKAPALEVLFQLPPRRKAGRVLTGLSHRTSYSFCNLNPASEHPPNLV